MQEARRLYLWLWHSTVVALGSIGTQNSSCGAALVAVQTGTDLETLWAATQSAAFCKGDLLRPPCNLAAGRNLITLLGTGATLQTLLVTISSYTKQPLGRTRGHIQPFACTNFH